MPPRLYPPCPPLAWIPSQPDATSLNPRAFPAALKHPPCLLSCWCWSPELTSLRRTFRRNVKGTGTMLILVLWGHPWMRKELSALPAPSPDVSQQEQWDLLHGCPHGAQQHLGRLPWTWSRDGLLHEVWNAGAVPPDLHNPHPGMAHPASISSQHPLNPSLEHTGRTLLPKGAGGGSNPSLSPHRQLQPHGKGFSRCPMGQALCQLHAGVRSTFPR